MALEHNDQAALTLIFITSTCTGSYSLLTDGEEDDKNLNKAQCD